MNFRIPIVRDAYQFLIPLLVLTVSSSLLGYRWTSAVLLFLTLFMAYFFRDPERSERQDNRCVVSPADGKVLEIEQNSTNEWLGENFTRVTIFLSVFNVHVNRSPHKGTVKKLKYVPGKFLAAFNKSASRENEQNWLLIEDGELQILVKQITGLIARRIVCWSREGDQLESGERFGLIRFGSRVDLFVPDTVQIRVKPSDKVLGGTTVIGVLSE